MKQSKVLNKMPHWDSYEVWVSAGKRAQARKFAETVERKNANTYKTDFSTLLCQSYLIGDNKNLFGTIIGFRKNMQRIDPSAANFSVFLYFSHETGRIERFMINEDKGRYQDLGWFSYGDLSNTLMRVENDPIMIEDDDQNYIAETISEENHRFQRVVTDNYPNKLLDLNLIRDAKLNKQFYDAFLLELLRDFFYTEDSFKVGDMRLLKELTLPIDSEPYEDPTFKKGCGELNMKAIDAIYNISKPNQSKEEFEAFIKEHFTKRKHPKFIDYGRRKHASSDKLLYLNVPKNFNWKVHTGVLNSQYLENTTIPQAKLPKSLIDLKTPINSRTIFSKVDLIRKVRDFNSNTFINLMNIYTQHNYRPDLFCDKNFSRKLRIQTTSKGFTMDKNTEPQNFNPSRDGIKDS